MAKDPRAINGWPKKTARLGTVAQIHALGQITINYNYLEESVGFMFVILMPTH
jgi:hypothetical protein